MEYRWGYGSLTQHLRNVHGITAESHKGKASGSGSSSQPGGYQTQLSGFTNQPGAGTLFHYTHQNMVEQIANYVINNEQPFTFAENSHYVRLNKHAFQPSYKPVNRQTLQRRCLKQYMKQKDRLMTYFANYNGRVCLTSDCWSAKGTNEQFICVTIHWIDTSWVLQKRII